MLFASQTGVSFPHSKPSSPSREVCPAGICSVRLRAVPKSAMSHFRASLTGNILNPRQFLHFKGNCGRQLKSPVFPSRSPVCTCTIRITNSRHRLSLLERGQRELSATVMPKRFSGASHKKSKSHPRRSGWMLQILSTLNEPL